MHTNRYLDLVILCLCVLQQYQNILQHELKSYRMIPGTLSVVVSDKVFFAAGYQGDKVSWITTGVFVTGIVVSGMHTCDQQTGISNEAI